MYMSPFQNSRSAFVGSRQPVMQQHIFRPQPAFLQPQPTQFGQLQGSSGPNPPSLQEVLAQRGFDMPAMPTGMQDQMMRMYKDPITGENRTGGAHAASHASSLGDFYGQNPEALEIAKQYNTDPTQFGGKPAPTRSLQQPIQPPIRPSIQQTMQSPNTEPEQALRDQRGAEIQEMQSMMREMMQMISALSNRGGFGGGYGGGFGGYSPRQQMMFGGIGSIPMSRGMFY